MSVQATSEQDLALAQSATGVLGVFNRAGVLGLADVHTAQQLGQIGNETDERVLLAIALTVSALRAGSVCVDLQTVHQTVFDDSEEGIDVSALPWPEADGWLEACRNSRLVTVGAEGEPKRPLRLAFGLLYLERYWLTEEQVRLQLVQRRQAPPPPVDQQRLAAAVVRVFSDPAVEAGPDLQRTAAVASALQWVSVVAGGPGTGKTTTVAKLLALLCDQPGPRPRIALAAPTGKAAARLEEAVNTARRLLPADDDQRLGELHAATLHRLLGWLPSSRSRFRHNASNHLPYDVIVVDEMSMVSLTLMARLLEAVRPNARLILVGDPDQLSSVEAGAVLADIVQAAELEHSEDSAPSPTSGPPFSTSDSQATEGDSSAAEDEPSQLLEEIGVMRGAPAVVRLQHTWRFGGSIDRLARAIRAGDADEAVAVLRNADEDVLFTEVDLDTAAPRGLERLTTMVRTAGRLVNDAAHSGDVDASLRALDHHRLLCAHRRGPYGATRWGFEAERWLREDIPGYGEEGEWYVGRPLLITANDYESGLYNGDTGVVVATNTGIRAAFARGSAASLSSPARLDDVQTFHAMTVHRAQGSQFRHVSFVLPPPDSPLLTRELLYTAVSRAIHQVMVFGSIEAVRRAIARPANRASGLRQRLG